MFRNTFAAGLLVGAIFGGVVDAAENKSDWTTLLNVKMALLEEVGGESLNVEVDAQGGALTLTGTVEKAETRERSEAVAKAVKGVTSVTNELKVETNAPQGGGTALGDALLTTRVRMALVRKMGDEGFQIGTQATNGVVTLRFGKELAPKRREMATRTAKAVGGVIKILGVSAKA